MISKRQKVAVVLFNLGGPDNIKNVRKFLTNIFSDKAIIDIPFGFRHLLAQIISRGRQQEARANYQLIGGRSPLLDETLAQEKALMSLLTSNNSQTDWLCVTAMRYWFPRAKHALDQLQEFDPDRVILLPLYPQYSTTTTGSSVDEWYKISKNKNWPISEILSYETNELFISAFANNVLDCWKKAGKPKNLRVLYSAHGLPEKIIAKGDPYQKQIEASAKEISRILPPEFSDWQVCYQSRVGPLKWIGPSTKEAIQKAAKDNKNLILVPISFVSEHLETLVELDIEMAEIAKNSGIQCFLRVETLRTSPEFIGALAALVENQLDDT